MTRLHAAIAAGLLTLWPLLPAAAAEFSQIRPDAQTLSELPTSDWLTNGGDLFNRNFSPLTEINTDNVDQLQPLWRTHLEGSGLGVK
jgi:glucose dehydrogenase